MNAAPDAYVPSPAGVAVPTVVPPAAHVVGALACGPNTLNVIVEVALLPELAASVAVIDAAEITVPAVPVAGAETDSVGLPWRRREVCWACGAGFQFVSPPWLASIVHVPLPTNEIVEPFVPPELQMLGVALLNATVRPEVAVAAAVDVPLRLWPHPAQTR